MKVQHPPRYVGNDRPRKRHHGRIKSSFFGTFLLALSIVGAGAFLGRSIERFRVKDRTVTVKGLSEKLVSSDLAIWSLTFRNAGNDLGKLEQKSSEDAKNILAFLKAKGFEAQEIEEGSTNVVDKNAREWGDAEKSNSNRFILSGTIILRTQKVTKVRENYAKVADLIRNGVVISGEPTYHYTKFLNLKQEMLAEASQNAVQAATNLISSGRFKLRGIRQAQQGTFTIRAKDAYSDEMGMNEASSLEKRIRVVTTVTFNIGD